MSYKKVIENDTVFLSKFFGVDFFIINVQPVFADSKSLDICITWTEASMLATISDDAFLLWISYYPQMLL